MNEFISAIIPNANLNFDVAMLIIGIILITHVIAICIIMKIIHGTKISTYYLDFVLMIWMCAILSWIIPIVVSNVIPDVAVTLATTT
jgi:archaellum biogenesis protein FlaJ (TadC family)